jgi:hypothetical protein
MLPASILTLEGVIEQVDGSCKSLKGSMTQALNTMQASNIDSNWVFRFIDGLNQQIATIQSIANAFGSINYPALNTYAQAQKKNPDGTSYTGVYTDDVTTTLNAAKACIAWIVANFPKDSTGTWILSHQLNADGTRTPRGFTPTDTAGLQAAITTLLATIS